MTHPHPGDRRQLTGRTPQRSLGGRVQIPPPLPRIGKTSGDLGAVPPIRVVAASRGRNTAPDVPSSVAAAPGRQHEKSAGGATGGTGAGGVRDGGEGDRRAGVISQM